MPEAHTLREPDPSLITVSHVTYALHALGLAIGAFGAATVVGSFVFGWPSIIAVIINYVKRGDARGTWLESHFTWQIRTFWFALLWAAIVLAIGAVLAIVLVGFAIWVVGLFVLGVWAIYRIARGWLRLVDRKAMP
ncbi:MAG TPA: hypothetical protein PLH72_04320 [Vicinamibacterales bacterium]|nr:hypothetical protein [Vicinamibacterales bacterium]